ncbi:MAG: hypothetical protein ACE5HV_02865, partial [Acidobacteriota bacterium]
SRAPLHHLATTAVEKCRLALILRNGRAIFQAWLHGNVGTAPYYPRARGDSVMIHPDHGIHLESK